MHDKPTTKDLAAMGAATGELAHDLGTMLSVIASHAAVLKASVTDPQLRGSAAAIVEATRAASHMLERVRGVIRARDSAGFVRVDPWAVVSRAVTAVETKALAAGCNVCLAQKIFTSSVAGLPTELLQLVINLVNNGIDAAGRGGTVIVGCGEAQGVVTLFVIDDGPGMPPEVSARLFQSAVSTKGGAGTGIGLLICHRIVQAHGGKISVVNGAHRGTRLEVRLPAAASDVPQASRPSTLEFVAHLAHRRVLIVDDDLSNLQAMRVLLEATGFDVLTCQDRSSALKLLGSQRPSLVVTDLDLGDGRDGLGWIRQLSALDASLPVIVCSGDPDMSKRRLMAAGASFVFRKPVEPATLIAAARSMVKQKRDLHSRRGDDGC